MTARLFEWGGELSGEQVDALRASAGWSANDWNMLQGMWGVDPEMYGFTRVAAAYETIVGKASPGVIGSSGSPPVCVCVSNSQFSR